MVSTLFVFLLLTLGASWSNSAHAEKVVWEGYIQAGDKAKQDDNLVKAEELYKSALVEAEKDEPHGYRVAVAYNKLGAIYKERKEYTQAELVYRRAVPMLEGALGPDHPEVANA